MSLSCAGVCSHNDIIVCPLSLNPVLFLPIADTANGGAWTCDALLSGVDAGKYFPSEMLSFPPGC